MKVVLIVCIALVIMAFVNAGEETDEEYDRWLEEEAEDDDY